MARPMLRATHARILGREPVITDEYQCGRHLLNLESV